MTAAQPEGVAWPADGVLSAADAEVSASRPFSVYVHVPFCSVRCGYCDFNTYVPDFGPGADRATYADSVIAEGAFARRALAASGFADRPASTVFFGGGTPTQLRPSELARTLGMIRDEFGIEAGAEVTTEANPDSIDEDGLALLADAGFTRVSFGMQSAVPHVLRTLDRTHTPERVPQVVAWAKAAGLDASVDLIYGTPGESLEDWRTSLEAAIAMDPDHISAYSLILEEGTALFNRVARGEVEDPDPDVEADKYELADRLLGDAGYGWYEISNFARPGHASRHNLAYWRDHDWWGLGPGAHSHIGSARWWNVKHPTAYAGRVAQGVSPAVAGEHLDPDTRHLEQVMLGIRTSEGVPVATVARDALPVLQAEGLVVVRGDRVVPTLRGRLMADLVTRRLLDL